MSDSYDPNGPTDDSDFDSSPSKSERKRQMHRLQNLGAQLTELDHAQLESLKLDEKLLESINTYHNINSREAKRRQLQYIGKLMRTVDTEVITDRLQQINAIRNQHSAVNKLSEQWRERLIQPDNSTALTEFFQSYPVENPQRLRQQIRKVFNAKSEIKKTTATRELFRLLRDIIQQQMHEN